MNFFRGLFPDFATCDFQAFNADDGINTHIRLDRPGVLPDFRKRENFLQWVIEVTITSAAISIPLAMRFGHLQRCHRIHFFTGWKFCGRPDIEVFVSIFLAPGQVKIHGVLRHRILGFQRKRLRIPMDPLLIVPFPFLRNKHIAMTGLQAYANEK